MDKLLLKQIIIEQKKQISKFDQGIEREKLNEISKYIKLPHTIVISGIRRVGKSTLLIQIMSRFFKNDFYYFNFEDERLLNFESKDFNALYELFLELYGKAKIFFLDEIQNVNGWEAFVRRMQENGFKFFITGSNASLLSKELGTKLTGRYISQELYPFSFKEFLCFKKYKLEKDALYQTIEIGKIKKLFEQYLKQGGMPEYVKHKNREILKAIYEDILYRDIVARYEIKEIKAFRELSLYFLANISNLISYNKLKGLLKLGSVNTVKSYSDYLENSFLIFTVNLFSYSLKQQFIAPKKIYCIDNGLTNAISFRFSQDQGRFLENLVFIELKRRGKEVYYYKTKNNLEVDFITRKGRNIDKVIQVTQHLSDSLAKQREIKGITQALKELKLKKGLILTQDQEDIIKSENKTIFVKPIYKWLLE